MNVRRTLLGTAILGLGLLLGAAPGGMGGDAAQSPEQAYMRASEKMNREMMKPCPATPIGTSPR